MSQQEIKARIELIKLTLQSIVLGDEIESDLRRELRELEKKLCG